jgi:hypothetical protein
MYKSNEQLKMVSLVPPPLQNQEAIETKHHVELGGALAMGHGFIIGRLSVCKTQYVNLFLQAENL